MIMKTSDMKLRMQRDLKAEQNDLPSSETTMISTDIKPLCATNRSVH